MDLNQLEAWTRDMLEAEARRAGVKGCEFRTRSELVRLILRDRYGETWSAGRERLARGVRSLSDARELLGIAIERTIASVLDEPEALEAMRQRQRGASSAEPVRTPERMPVRTPKHTPEREVTAEFATREDADAGVDQIECVGDTDAVVRWRATEAGLVRARAVLGSDGDLAVRTVVVSVDPATWIVRPHVADHGPVARTGDLPLPPRPDGARRLAAIGLCAGERFVAIAHTRA